MRKLARGLAVRFPTIHAVSSWAMVMAFARDRDVTWLRIVVSNPLFTQSGVYQ